jgi:hypothetical protein
MSEIAPVEYQKLTRPFGMVLQPINQGWKTFASWPTHISEACTINTSGFDFRQGQTPAAGGFWCAGLLHRVREQGFTQPAPIDTTCPSFVSILLTWLLP